MPVGDEAGAAGASDPAGGRVVLVGEEAGAARASDPAGGRAVLVGEGAGAAGASDPAGGRAAPEGVRAGLAEFTAAAQFEAAGMPQASKVALNGDTMQSGSVSVSDTAAAPFDAADVLRASKVALDLSERMGAGWDFCSAGGESAALVKSFSRR